MKKHNKEKKCFVCRETIKGSQRLQYNKRTGMPVCPKCQGTEAEKKAETEALDSLAEGFVCGCI